MTTSTHTSTHTPDDGLLVVLDEPDRDRPAEAGSPFRTVDITDITDITGGATDPGDGPASGAPVGIVLAAPVGAQPHRGRFGRRGFLKVLREGAPTTTRQAEVLNTAIIGSPTDERGVVIGIDRISAAMIAHDPFTAYEAKHITSPNVCVLGMIGAGKSSLIKTVYVERPLLLKDRRAVVVDKKMREGEGEYAQLTRRFGGEPFRFEPGTAGPGSTCMNVLDEVILAGGGPAQQIQLLAAMAEQAGTGQLDEWHHKALRTAYRATMRAFELGVPGRAVPVLPDLVEQFGHVLAGAEFTGLRPATLDLLEERAWSMRLRFERMLGQDLQGMFDRETSRHVVLHPKLTTFDISALPEDGPATSMVMVVANAWLMGMLTGHRGLRTNFIAEEGWHLLGGPGGKVIRSKSKLSRGLGLSIVAAIHHISDIPADSEAVAMIKEAQTIHLFRQEHDDDIADCVRYFNLEHSNGASLGTLAQGDHLLKVGTRKEIKVQHIRTAGEIAFTETDSALITRPAPEVVTGEPQPGL